MAVATTVDVGHSQRLEHMELEQLRNSDSVSWELQIDPAIRQKHTWMPPLVIQPFAENAIWHGILPKNAPGRVVVALALDSKPNTLLCRVEDDGVGLTQQPGTEGSRHQGRAIQLTEQRLDGNVQLHHRPGGGTIASFEIPTQPAP